MPSFPFFTNATSPGLPSLSSQTQLIQTFHNLLHKPTSPDHAFLHKNKLSRLSLPVLHKLGIPFPSKAKLNLFLLSVSSPSWLSSLCFLRLVPEDNKADSEFIFSVTSLAYFIARFRENNYRQLPAGSRSDWVCRPPQGTVHSTTDKEIRIKHILLPQKK